MDENETYASVIRKALEVCDEPVFVAWAKRWLSGEDRTYESARTAYGQLRFGRNPGLSEVFGLSTARAAIELVMDRTTQGDDGAQTAASVDAWFRRHSK